jgi:uncharacterized protein
VNAYVDSSVLLRIILDEPDALAAWARVTQAVSIEVIRLECLRTIDRARIVRRLDDAEVADRRARVLETIETFTLVPLVSPVLERAAEPFPTMVGSLDAIHLASALIARETFEELVFATHDAELGIAARSVGFTVDGVAL